MISKGQKIFMVAALIMMNGLLVLIKECYDEYYSNERTATNVTSGLAVAEKSSTDGQYNYCFPSDRATPFDTWNTKDAIMKPEDKDAAEFAGMFTAKMMTIVSGVENTKGGKRVYVIVANQHCLIDIVRHDGEYLATATKCSTKPFGKF